MRSCRAQLRHRGGEVGRGRGEDGVGDEFVDGGEGGSGDWARGFGRADDFEERVEEGEGVDGGVVCGRKA
jgi:hypothetical protein